MSAVPAWAGIAIGDRSRICGGAGTAVVAAANPTVCLDRVIPARWTSTPKPARDEALIRLPASPV
jgi:hypothetical protein